MMEKIEYLDDFIQQGDVLYYDDDTSFFNLLVDNYPIESNRINWDAIQHKSWILGRDRLKDKGNVEKLVVSIFDTENINDEQHVIVLFDEFLRVL